MNKAEYLGLIATLLAGFSGMKDHEGQFYLAAAAGILGGLAIAYALGWPSA